MKWKRMQIFHDVKILPWHKYTACYLTWRNYQRMGGFAVEVQKQKSNLLKVAMLNVVIIKPTKSKWKTNTHHFTLLLKSCEQKKGSTYFYNQLKFVLFYYSMWTWQLCSAVVHCVSKQTMWTGYVNRELPWKWREFPWKWSVNRKLQSKIWCKSWQICKILKLMKQLKLMQICRSKT